MASISTTDSSWLLSERLLERGWRRSLTTLDYRNFIVMTRPDGYRWLTSPWFLFYPFVSHKAVAISANKNLANDFITSLGLTSPPGIKVTDYDEDTRDFLQKYSPIVVKPLNGASSVGLTLDVTTDTQLEEAINLAKIKSGFVILQKQVKGSELRLTVYEDKVVSCLLRDTPKLVGDGESSIRSLIENENVMRSKLTFPYMNYPLLSEKNIPPSFLTDERTLKIGEVVELSRATMIGRGASFYEINDTVDDSYKEMAIKIAGELETSFLAVDLMVEDYHQNAASDNYSFIEMNTAAALKAHYLTRNRLTVDVIGLIADKLDSMPR